MLTPVLVIAALWIVLGSLPVIACIRSSQFNHEIDEYERYVSRNSVPISKEELQGELVEALFELNAK